MDRMKIEVSTIETSEEKHDRNEQDVTGCAVELLLFKKRLMGGLAGAGIAAATSVSVVSAQATSVPDAIYYDAPGMSAVTVASNIEYRTVTIDGRPTKLEMDVYRPPSLGTTDRRPALIFVHGGLTVDQPRTAKDWGIYRSWGRAAAASGLVGVTFNHRLTTNDNVDVGSGDLTALIEFIRRNAAQWNVDPDRLCLAFYSAGGPLASVPLRERAPYMRCVVLYYPFLDLEHMRYQTQFRPAHAPAHVDSLLAYSPARVITHDPASVPPVLLAMAGRDAIPRLNESVVRFLQAAVDSRVRVDFYMHPTGEHGFDRRNRDDRTREIIEATLAFVKRHTGASQRP
jgi:acetyl esterase/lipase